MGIAPTRACGEDEAPSALVLAWYRAASVSGDMQGGWGLGHCLRGEVHSLQLGGGPQGRCGTGTFWLPLSFRSLFTYWLINLQKMCFVSRVSAWKEAQPRPLLPQMLQLLSAPTETAGARYHSAQRYFSLKSQHRDQQPVCCFLSHHAGEMHCSIEGKHISQWGSGHQLLGTPFLLPQRPPECQCRGSSSLAP